MCLFFVDSFIYSKLMDTYFAQISHVFHYITALNEEGECAA